MLNHWKISYCPASVPFLYSMMSTTILITDAIVVDEISGDGRDCENTNVGGYFWFDKSVDSVSPRFESMSKTFEKLSSVNGASR